MKTRHIIAAAIMVTLLMPLNSQNTNTVYFMEEVAERNNLNPAFTPNCKFYFDFVFMPNFYLKAGTNSFTLNNLIYNKNGLTQSFMSSPEALDRFYRSIRPTTNAGVEFGLNLLSFGFQIKEKHYVTFDFGLHANANAYLPKDLFRLALYGTPDAEGVNSFNFRSLGVDMILYSSVAIGYMNKINDQWTVGGKAKFLMGYASMSTSIQSMGLDASLDNWTLTTKGHINASLPVSFGTDANGYLDPSTIKLAPTPALLSLLYQPAGMGAAIDLGVTYKPIKHLTVSAAITDLGFIHWSRNSILGTMNGSYTIDKIIDFTQSEDGSSSAGIDEGLTELGNEILGNMKVSEGKAYSQMLRANFIVGAEYGILRDKISFGALSRTSFNATHISEEVTAAVNFRPADWFKTTISYSFVDGRWGTLGLGLNLRVGMFNTYIIADYLPITWSSVSSTKYDLNNIPLPNRLQQFNIQAGWSWNLGRFSSDKDNDGVINRKDHCKDTDIKYLQSLCPGLKKKELVDRHGCTRDQDQDGIPDCYDRCPDTPKGVVVDSVGCPVDTDHDGIADYLDMCPDTPEGIEVDSKGCPLDEDADGVPDYLDNCPGTPDNVVVDSAGCPVDSDGDGVPDYLDKCPDTPAEAYATVDENGCPADSDRDGVPDYIDKCPDTRPNLEVDQFGCPIDSDSDGVPDSVDRCPDVAGPASNFGCPELTKEVKSLLTKAMTGIEFQTSSDVIKKSSYPILDQIVAVMELNPEYRLAIKGYTDNTGKASLNLELSKKRAAAVMTYMIAKGISATRMTSEGYGDANPIASNKTAAGRAKNRRVEFEISYEKVTYEKVVNPELQDTTIIK